MKKINKLIPFVMTAALLAGCSSELALQDTDKTIINTEEKDGLDLVTNQEVFEELFASLGASTTAQEIVYRIARDVVHNSENDLLGKKGSYLVAGYTFEYERLAEKVKEKFDTYYAATYKRNGLFNEKLLVNSLLSSGYDIDTTDGYYEEKANNLLGYDKLADHLKGDYSELIEESLLKSVYLELLKEEYIYEVHSDYLRSTSTSSDTAYSAYAKTKYVEYFSYTPAKASEANEINTKLTAELDKLLETKNDNESVTKDEFQNLVVNQFEAIVKDYAMENLVKEFAKINYKANDGKYSDGAIGEYEKEYVDKYLDIYASDASIKLTSDEISEAKSLISTYSSNSSYSIFHGYELKQLDVASKQYYEDMVVSTKSATVINSSIDAKLKVTNDKLDLTNGFLDYYNNDNPLFKLDGTYYIVRVQPIYNHKYNEETKEVEKSTDAEILDAVELLATHSSYTSNAIKYYLDSYYEEGKFTVHNEELYDYLNDNYNFEIEE